jgi:outer membrane protein
MKSAPRPPASIATRLLPAMLFACLGVTIVSPGWSDDSGRGENRARIEPKGFFYGGALGVRREVYEGFDRRVIPLPVIGYRGDRLLVFGPFVNYEIVDTGALSFDLRLSPRFQGFDESDSDVFRGMEERKFSMDAGAGLTWERNDWKVELVGLADILGRSDGQEWRFGLSRAYRAGKLLFEPSVGLSYLDSRHVEYYYGVDDDEATGTRPAYSGSSALNTRLGLNLFTAAWFGGLTRIGIENTWYDSPIEDSPLTDTDSSLGVFIAFSKFFDG